MVWLIPILIIAITAYIDMKKGQSIEEYIKENKMDDPECYILIFFPGTNCFVALYLIGATICDKVKHFRK